MPSMIVLLFCTTLLFYIVVLHDDPTRLTYLIYLLDLPE